MNQYIVSQWFKYKENLRLFYEKYFLLPRDNNQDALALGVNCNSIKVCNECRKNQSMFCESCDKVADNMFERFDGHCVMDISVEILKHLLDLVINQAEKPLNLRLIDTSFEYIEGGCYDALYFLKDRRGHYWIIKSFYGTYDTWMKLEGMTKKEWITLLMHLSLGMIQNLRRCDEMISNSLIVSSKDSCVCTIKYLINLKGLSKLHGMYRWYLLETLENLPRKSLDSLFALMSVEQKAKIEKILDTVNVEEEKLFNELATVQHPAWVMALMGSERADLLIKKIEEFGLKGYLAICFRGCEAIGELHYGDEKSYQVMEEYDRQFDGNSYFIAVGSTLTKLLKDIEKKSME